MDKKHNNITYKDSQSWWDNSLWAKCLSSRISCNSLSRFRWVSSRWWDNSNKWWGSILSRWLTQLLASRWLWCSKSLLSSLQEWFAKLRRAVKNLQRGPAQFNFAVALMVVRKRSAMTVGASIASYKTHAINKYSSANTANLQSWKKSDASKLFLWQSTLDALFSCAVWDLVSYYGILKLSDNY